MVKAFKIVLILILVGCNSKPRDSFEDSVITMNSASLSGFDFSKQLVRKFIEQDIKYPKQEIMTVLKKQIIEDFVIQNVYDEYAREHNLLVKKELLDEAFNKFRDGYPDQDSFEVFLNESGQNKGDFRDMLKNRITRELVQEKLFSEQDFKVDAKEILEFYNQNKESFKREEQVKLKQIVFETEEDGIKIEELLKKANYKNFETLATKYSLGPEKIDGGDLGWRNVKSFPAFEEAAKTSVGKVSPIIKSENGSHIFKIVDKRKSSTLSLNEATLEIEKRLQNDKKTEFLNGWIKDRIAQSKLVVNEDLINKINVNRPTNL